MTFQIYAGLTSQTVRFFIQDTSSTSGAGLTGLTSATSGLTAYYSKGGTGSATAITLASQTATGAWTSGGFCAVDGTNMPGVYRLDIPNAALDSEVETIIMLRGAASMAPVCLRVTGRVFASDGVKWGGVSVTGMPMPTYTQPTGFLAATFPATVSSYAGGAVASVTGSVGSVTNSVTVGTNNDKTGYSLTVTPPTAAAIADAVWDEILTGATHNVQNSAGKRLRTIASQVVHTGTAQGPGTGSNQIQLDTGASATDGVYDPSMVFIESGTGAGQSRLITQYVGSTRTATVDRDWRVAPAADSVFVIQATIGFNSTNEGLAQGGTSTTIVLNASANSVDDCYNGQLVFLKSGTGQDQVAIVEDYTGSTRTALIRTRRANGQWATIPDTTTGYMMVPNLTWTIDEIQSGLATAAALATITTYVDTEVAAIKVVTDRLNTGLVADGAVYQFTANMLELAPAGGGGAGDASQTTLLQVQSTVNGIASSLSGVPITATGRIADGGTISLYCGDDLRVRSGTQLTLTVTDVGGSIYSRLNTIGTGNLAFGASRRGLPVSAISGSIASLTSVGSGASQTVRLVVEIDNAGGSLQPAEDYEWQIESEQTQGAEIDQLVEMAGILILRRRTV